MNPLFLLFAAAELLAAQPESNDWRVTVDGRPVVLRKVDISISENHEPEVNRLKKGVWYRFGSFALTAPARVRIQCADSLERLEILPKKFAIDYERVTSNEIAFTAAKPFRLAFCPRGRVGSLHLFANAPEANLPRTVATNVIYRGPGVHVERNLIVRSNQTLVIDDGAVVYGRLDIRGTNITVCGSGIVSGGRFERFKSPGAFSNGILNATNVTVRGISIVDPCGWTIGIRDSRQITLDGIRIFGGRMINDDGIDVINSSDVTIRNSFVRTQDDNICAKGMGYDPEGRAFDPVENLLVENCELWTDQANNFRFGFECDAAYMRNLRIRDVDILAYSPFSRPFADIWCHAVIKAQSAEGMEISGIDVENMRVHSDGGDICLIYLEPRPTWIRRRGEGRHRYQRGGTIRNCRFADIEVYGEERGFTGWIYLKDRSAKECVRNVTLENIRYFGRPIDFSSTEVIRQLH